MAPNFTWLILEVLYKDSNSFVWIFFLFHESKEIQGKNNVTETIHHHQICMHFCSCHSLPDSQAGAMNQVLVIHCEKWWMRQSCRDETVKTRVAFSSPLFSPKATRNSTCSKSIRRDLSHYWTMLWMQRKYLLCEVTKVWGLIY